MLLLLRQPVIPGCTCSAQGASARIIMRSAQLASNAGWRRPVVRMMGGLSHIARIAISL